MLLETLRSARDIGRLHEIAGVLMRYGFSDVVQRLGMQHVLERAGRVLHWKDAETLAHLTPPERICSAFQELGPCYVKLGQILATRIDIFPPEWIREFEKLQDEAPPVPYEDIGKQLAEAFGKPAEEAFAHVERAAFAAASIAQVHLARMEDGTEVVLKVRRPGIEDVIEADLHLLSKLAELAENRLPEAKRYQAKEIVRQFTLSLRRELDLASEARNSERIARSFASDPTIVIPRIYWTWTTSVVNVQQYLKGVRGRDIAGIEQAGLDRKVLAARGAAAVLKMILVDGFYHADPHLGNFFCLEGNRLGLIDFGMVGRLSETRRGELVDLLQAIVSRQSYAVTEILLEWSGEPNVDAEQLASEVDAFIDSYYGVPLKRIDFAALLTDMMALVRDHALTWPPDLSLLIKALITLEGVGRRLDPDFDMISALTPFVEQAMAERYVPSALAKRGLSHARDTFDLIAGLPADVRRLLRMARRGALQINVDVSRLNEFGNTLDRAASRVTVGVVTAAIIIGSSIVMSTESEREVFGMPMLGFLGFLGACAGGIWLLFSIWRSGRKHES